MAFLLETLPIPAHLSKAELLAIVTKETLAGLIAMPDNEYRSVMTQLRYVGVASTNSTRGYYRRKAVHPFARVLSDLRQPGEPLESVTMWARFRTSVMYLRSGWRQSHADYITPKDRRKMYNRKYYLRRKRERALDVVRLTLPRAAYDAVVSQLKVAGMDEAVTLLTTDGQAN